MVLMGLQKLTLLDYPGKMSCTVFTGGCNFRCPFCHNASLVTESDYEANLTEKEFFDFLDLRKGILSGVAVTGGEPTLQPDLEAFLEKIKNKGYLVKLDTNGFKPDRLKKIINSSLADYIAMDIKNSKSLYGKTVGIENLSIEPIIKSTDFLMQNNVPFEFRTTIVKEFHSPESIREIGEWLKGNEKFFLQAFEDSGDLVGKDIHGLDKNEMIVLLNVLKKYIPNAELRGI